MVERVAQLEDGVWVAGQLVEGDVAAFAARGFKSIVNNRPDGEAEGQMTNATASREAERLGLTFRYQPVANLNVTDDEVVVAFGRAMDELPRPILFYCRTGTRCTILWAQANAQRLGVSKVVEVAAKAGYDLEGIRDILEESAAEP